MTGTQGTYGPVITRMTVMHYARTHIRVITGGYVPCVPAVLGLTLTRASGSAAAWRLSRLFARAARTVASSRSAHWGASCAVMTAAMRAWCVRASQQSALALARTTATSTHGAMTRRCTSTKHQRDHSPSGTRSASYAEDLSPKRSNTSLVAFSRHIQLLRVLPEALQIAGAVRRRRLKIFRL
jgi:hypothetical protein